MCFDPGFGSNLAQLLKDATWEITFFLGGGGGGEQLPPPPPSKKAYKINCSSAMQGLAVLFPLELVGIAQSNPWVVF